MVSRRSYWVFLLLATAVVVVGCANAPAPDSGGALLPEQAAYDVTYYRLDVSIDPARQTIEGEVEVHAAVESRIESFVLNLDRRLSVGDVVVDTEEGPASRPVERRDGGNEVWVALRTPRSSGDSLRVTLEYGGQPRVAPRPPWDGGFTWKQTPDGDPWVATSSQTGGPDLWWPAKDHPSDEPDSMSIAVTVPDGVVAASNGCLQNVQPASDSTRTFRWHVSTPINAYGVALNIAPYSRIDTTYASTSGSPVPVSFYVLPSNRDSAERSLPGFLDQVRFLEKTLGPYPFRADKYGVAETPFLGMEHQSIIAYGHDFTTGGLGYDASFDALHFHELAHEWYGNLVTVADWKDFWIHEGPATYLEALYAESVEGDSAYHALTDHFRDRVVGGTAVASREPATAKTMYHGDVYFRGAMTLHTLRFVVGEEAIRQILRQFVSSEGSGPAFRHVTTQDFVDTAEAVSDRSLDAFFDVYLYQSALPRLETTRTESALELRWTGTGETAFEVPVPVRINGTVQRVDMPGGTGRVSIPDGATVEVDPKGWLLRAE